MGPNWAWGTRRSSAWAPGTWPYSLVYPNRLAPLRRLLFCVVEHWEYSWSEHWSHQPQEMLNGTTTRSPGCRPGTSGPTSSTTPMGS
jgi:hypothetical protein